ncbi:hypothetical protein QR680_008510 [Steinernema hermaphroditum]|uniref:Serine/threonine-protein phosphatase n=1 Tax=Steinernema hermaphroditum TaxID=289476 RepID=A0AA39M758_9BILA|nr:hypothetical protein QR680_008510 [Steinernema hermaphroditum]
MSSKVVKNAQSGEMTAEAGKPSVKTSASPEEKSLAKTEGTQYGTPAATDEKKADEGASSPAKSEPESLKEEKKPVKPVKQVDPEPVKKKTKVSFKSVVKAHLAVDYEVKPDEEFQLNYDLNELNEILDMAKNVFIKEPTLLEVSVPVNICGDTHGQFGDVRQIFSACGFPFKSRYLFLGDYVDRGPNSLEVIVFLFSLKIKFPKHIYLLRGNHELRNINKVYGFHADLRDRFRQHNEYDKLYKKFNDVFAHMPLAALVSGRILCMHGGLSPKLNHLDDIRNIQRPITKVKDLAQDLLWADPEKGVMTITEGSTGFEPNKLRAVSYIFGEAAVEEKCKKLGIEMIIRAHQVVEFGYAFFANRKLITVFSASEYDTNLHNYGGVVQIDKQLEIRFVQINARDYRPNSLRTEVEEANEEEQPRTGDVPEDEDAGGNTVRAELK